jgi:site-specific DNA recombinase
MGEFRKWQRVMDPMIAAIYVRKSTEQTGVADEQKSVARQVDHSRAYAAAKGWTVDEACVFKDDGISGAEFAARPGFLRLMNALKPRPPFQVLIMSEVSRLGREQIETAYALKQLSIAGVRCFSYLEDRELLVESATDKFLLGAVTFAADLEREKARQRTYDAMLRKARAGHVTGGRVFGYDNQRTDRGAVVRVVNDTEAAIVREIFDRCGRGQGFRTIAHALNDQRAPSPRAQQGRSNGWCASSVREVLHRPLYRGEIVWNKTRKRNTWGLKQQQRRPDGDRVTVPAPQLRIVAEDAWTAAHERLGASRDTYLRATDGRLWGKPANGIESKYLLTGLMQCATCGGGLHVATRSHGRGRRAHFYACTTSRNKGLSVCANNRQAVMEEADWEVTTAVQDELLDPAVVAFALETALVSLVTAPADDVADRIAELRVREADLERNVQHLTDAIAAGGELAALVAAVKQRERERQRVHDERVQLEKALRDGPLDAAPLKVELARRVDEWRTMAGRTVAQGRQVLRKLLRGRVLVTPREDGQLELSGQADYGKLFSGIVLATAMASPTGPATRWTTQFSGIAA